MYKIIFSLLYVVSLLPLRILYVLSDIIYFILYYVMRYRRKVTMHNLTIAFPDKTKAEKIKMTKQCLRGLADIFAEIIKSLSISKQALQRRATCLNPQVINDIADPDNAVRCITTHCYNWDMVGLSFSAYLERLHFVAVYKQIRNQHFDRLMLYIRQRFGGIMIAAHEYRKRFAQVAKQPYCLVLIADQNPDGAAYWTNFFGQLVPFPKGIEKGVMKNNIKVIFMKVKKIKRGYYQTILEPITVNATAPEGTLTKLIVQKIEEELHSVGGNYLWTHKRFKRVYNETEHGASFIG